MLIKEQDNIFSHINNCFTNNRRLILLLGRPGMGKTFISKKIINILCEKPLFISGVGLTSDKIDMYELSKYDGVVFDEITYLSKDIVHRVKNFIVQCRVRNIPLIATAPSFNQLNEKIQKLFDETYEIMPFSDESILKILLDKQANENVCMSNRLLQYIVHEAKGIPRRAIEQFEILNGKSINTNEIYYYDNFGYKKTDNDNYILSNNKKR